MSPTNKSYRVCRFDAALKVVTADFVKAANDEEAIAAAEAAGFGTKCEIWDGNRLVAERPVAEVPIHCAATAARLGAWPSPELP